MITAVPLDARGRRVGVLALRRVGRRGRGAALRRDERFALRAVGGMLAAAIAASERAEELAGEAAASMRAIEAQHRFIQRIIDSLPVGLYVVDRDYRVHVWNRKRETGLQGVLREEALGRTIFEILRRQPADLLRREFDEVFRTGEVMQLEVESSASGEGRTYRVSKIPMRLDDGEVTHVITVGEDITDWKRAQARVAQAEKLAALGQLAAGVMHEINNPLATIGACAETMLLRLEESSLADGFSETFGECCQIIDQEVHRCKRIVDGLLDFSRPKSEDKEWVDPCDVVEHTLFLLKHHARFKQVVVDTALDRSIGRAVHASREQLVQVVMALLLNAVDAMGGTGTIRVRTFVRGGTEVIIEVQDEGHGIPASELGKIFEPFYTTKSPGRGTGLGLSICYSIVASHGGRIEVESVVGRGSTFRVCLPVGAREARA